MSSPSAVTLADGSFAYELGATLGVGANGKVRSTNRHESPRPARAPPESLAKLFHIMSGVPLTRFSAADRQRYTTWALGHV